MRAGGKNAAKSSCLHLKANPSEGPAKKKTSPTHPSNRKEREEHKEDPFVRDTRKTFCDVLACLADLAVQVRVQPVLCATFIGWIFIYMWARDLDIHSNWGRIDPLYSTPNAYVGAGYTGCLKTFSGPENSLL